LSYDFLKDRNADVYVWYAPSGPDLIAGGIEVSRIVAIYGHSTLTDLRLVTVGLP
jgi:hypothetical protein